MTACVSKIRKRLAGAFVLSMLLIGAAPAAFAGNELAGQWTLTITIPDAPRSKTTRTFMVNLDVSPRGESLQGRLNITDEAGLTVGGAWRQVGKNLSITYELPCTGDGSPCASLILLGRVKGGGVLIKKGSVVVMWDTMNDRNPALYDTSNGSFRGTRIDQ